MKSPEDILQDAFIGKKIKSFSFGNEGERENAIGKFITKVSFGFNDSREDAGMMISYRDEEFGRNTIFVYDNEEIEVEEQT